MSHLRELPAGVPLRSRIEFIDHAKAIGIVLVVLGHAPGMPEWLDRVIFGFHMPLFFFAAGFLVSQKTLELPLTAYLRKLFVDLGLPYMLFFSISYGYWLITRSLGARAGKFADVSWIDPLIGFALGMGDVRLVNPVLWFFPCLAACALLYRLIYGWSSGNHQLSLLWAALISAVGLYWAHQGRPTDLPFSFEIAFGVMVFYALGVLLRRRAELWPIDWSRARRWLLVVAAACFLVALAAMNGRVDLSDHVVGDHLWLLLVEASAGIALILGIGSLLGNNSISQWLARNTLTIFPMHVLFYNVISGVAKLGFGQPEGFSETVSWGLAYAVIGLALCVPAVIVLRRLFPAIVGR